MLITYQIKDLMGSSGFGVVSKNRPFISKRKHRICQLERTLEIIQSSLLSFSEASPDVQVKGRWTSPYIAT